MDNGGGGNGDEIHERMMLSRVSVVNRCVWVSGWDDFSNVFWRFFQMKYKSNEWRPIHLESRLILRRILDRVTQIHILGSRQTQFYALFPWKMFRSSRSGFRLQEPSVTGAIQLEKAFGCSSFISLEVNVGLKWFLDQMHSIREQWAPSCGQNAFFHQNLSH